MQRSRLGYGTTICTGPQTMLDHPTMRIMRTKIICCQLASLIIIWAVAHKRTCRSSEVTYSAVDTFETLAEIRQLRGGDENNVEVLDHRVSELEVFVLFQNLS